MTDSHTTDPIGARNLDKEANSRLIINKDAAPASSKSEDAQEPTPGSDGTMLEAVSQLHLSLIPRHDVSTFVPNSNMMFTVLSAMDDLMISNRYWSARLDQWTPLYSRLYYGILFYIQIFRCMIAAGIATRHIRSLMRDFNDIYPLEQLPVAGPMTLFLKALAISEPPYSNYGPISPTVPPTPGTTAANNQTLEPHIRILLPNITGLRRAINTMRFPPVLRVPYEWDSRLGDTSIAAVAITHTAPNEQARDARVMPGTIHPIGYTVRQRSVYNEYPTHSPVPNVNAAATDDNWAFFLGLDGDMQWFGRIAAIMELHSHYFKGTTVLNSLSPRNGPFGLIQVRGDTVYPDRNAHRATTITSISHSGTAHSNATEIVAPADMLSCFTQINWKPPANYSPIDDTTGDINVTLFGPWWSVSPEQLRSVSYSPDVLVPAILARAMHTERPSLT